MMLDLAATSELVQPNAPAFWFPRGRLVELSGAEGSACTTTAVSALLEAQREGEPAVWIQPEGGPLFPPDLVCSGVDLDALVVIHIPDGAGEYGIPKAAEMMLRSGGFGLVVLDLRARVPRDEVWLSRLLGLAREHQSRVVLLTRLRSRHTGALGSLVSVRIEPRRVRVGRGVFHIEHDVLKDKTGLFSVGITSDPRRGPWGLM